MISYAQNHEDVVLARAFGHRRDGFYIDVGAEHPAINSVTKHFYDLGWRGINIEPSASSVADLDRERPEDTNLAMGLADAAAKMTYYEGPIDNHGASTFRADIADIYRRAGQLFTEVSDVAVTTLAAVCEDHVGDRTIDFLKIDVEGLEAAVLAGADWRRWRPRVVVVEATHPNSHSPSHQGWEPLLLEAGYQLTLFDGLNRFYVRHEDPSLIEPMSSPASVLDDFVGAEQAKTAADLRTAISANVALHTQLAGLHGAADQLRHQTTQLRRGLRLTTDSLANAEDEILRRELAAGVLRDRLAAETAAHRASRDALAMEADHRAALLATKTFRWTAAARSVYGFFRKRQRD